MTVAVLSYAVEVRAHIEKPKAAIQFRILRDGEVTEGYKYLVVFRGFSSMGVPVLAFESIADLTATRLVDQSELQRQGEWLVIGSDDAVPKRARAVYMELSESGVYTVNLTSEAGQTGDLASVASTVKVDKLPASRELVAIEKDGTGEWRLAGNTTLHAADLEMRVTGGAVFVIGIDDYGYQYRPYLSVTEGQRIRPSDMQGWLYLITQAGQLPAQEPEWWPAQGENPPRQLGTARAQAVRYYRPQALGPIKYELK